MISWATYLVSRYIVNVFFLYGFHKILSQIHVGKFYVSNWGYFNSLDKVIEKHPHTYEKAY